MKQNNFDPKFETANGQLNEYAFACGYIQTIDSLTLHKELYREHNVYHVRSTFNNSPALSTKFDGQTSHSYVIWETFDKLTEARKFYNRIK